MTGAAPLRVLVVEDEVLVAMLIEDMLRELGCEVVALSGTLDDALRRAQADDLDVAVLDVNLNGRQSLPVADALRVRGLPFLFATGYGRKILGVAYDGVPVLQKPFGRDELRGALAKVLPGRL
ncbi:MAG: response regulator [Reyranellaceae bacterium]